MVKIHVEFHLPVFTPFAWRSACCVQSSRGYYGNVYRCLSFSAVEQYTPELPLPARSLIWGLASWFSSAISRNLMAISHHGHDYFKGNSKVIRYFRGIQVGQRIHNSIHSRAVSVHSVELLSRRMALQLRPKSSCAHWIDSVAIELQKDITEFYQADCRPTELGD